MYLQSLMSLPPQVLLPPRGNGCTTIKISHGEEKKSHLRDNGKLTVTSDIHSFIYSQILSTSKMPETITLHFSFWDRLTSNPALWQAMQADVLVLLRVQIYRECIFFHSSINIDWMTFLNYLIVIAHLFRNTLCLVLLPNSCMRT